MLGHILYYMPSLFLFTGAMETTTQATTECPIGMEPDSSVFEHVDLKPDTTEKTGKRALVTVPEGSTQDTVTITSMPTPVQFDSVQVTIEGATDVQLGDLVVEKDGEKPGSVKPQSADNIVITYDLLKEGVGFSLNGLEVVISWTRPEAGTPFSIAIVIKGCIKSGETSE